MTEPTADEVLAYIKDHLGVELYPFQERLVDTIMSGEPYQAIIWPKRSGRTTIAECVNTAVKELRGPAHDFVILDEIFHDQAQETP